jgi:malate dehydrogenase (quinone)
MIETSSIPGCQILKSTIEEYDVLLIGGGIMSANLGAMLKRLDPTLKIQLLEGATEPAMESSNGWNNAGTGHAGYCEISYTPKREADGTVNPSRAIAICEQFEHSKQFWSFAVAQGMLEDPRTFVRPVPHIALVFGQQDVDFLRDRHKAMVSHHFFDSMTYSEDPNEIGDWAPLVMEGRSPCPVAATKMEIATEINFGCLAAQLIGWLGKQKDCAVSQGVRAISIRRDGHSWRIHARCRESGELYIFRTKYVFVGAGGGSLPLLQSTGLSEVRGLAGFPIAGQWLVSDNEHLADRHWTKVYGMTPPSAPSLGGPHLDIRWLDGKRKLMFGPFASWTTKFLKCTGSWGDLLTSIRLGNFSTLLRSGLHNQDMVRYLVTQAMQSMEHRMSALREFYPQALPADWRLVHAGIRVQTIKKADRGAIYFGTEVFSSRDSTLTSLLGASPGASVSVDIALQIIRRWMPDTFKDESGYARMKEMIPTFDIDIKQPYHKEAFYKASENANHDLRLS